MSYTKHKTIEDCNINLIGVLTPSEEDEEEEKTIDYIKELKTRNHIICIITSISGCACLIILIVAIALSCLYL